MEPAPLDLSPKEWQDYYLSTGRAYVQFTLRRTTGEFIGTLVVELFTDMCPKTCNNFLELTKGTGKYKYQGTPIHRVVKGGYIQGGDVVDGSGAGEPNFKIPDESYAVKHTAKGFVGMATMGQSHTASSQFYITLQPLPWLDGKRVVFGRVVGDASFKTLDTLEEGMLRNERPTPDILIQEASVIWQGS